MTQTIIELKDFRDFPFATMPQRDGPTNPFQGIDGTVYHWRNMWRLNASGQSVEPTFKRVQTAQISTDISER